MGSYTPNKGLYKADPATDAKDTFNITKMLNDNWDKLDVEEEAAALQAFEALCSQPGNKVTTTLTTQDGFDTWVDIVTKDGQELARCVDVQSAGEGGRDVWTKTITIAGRAPVTFVDKEMENNGWESVVS